MFSRPRKSKKMAHLASVTVLVAVVGIIGGDYSAGIGKKNISTGSVLSQTYVAAVKRMRADAKAPLSAPRLRLAVSDMVAPASDDTEAAGTNSSTSTTTQEAAPSPLAPSLEPKSSVGFDRSACVLSDHGNVHDVFNVDEKSTLGDGSWGKVVKATNLGTKMVRACKIMTPARWRRDLGASSADIQKEINTIFL